MSSGNGGPASAGPRPRRRKARGSARTVSATRRSVVHDVRVLNWVRAVTRAGLTSKQVVDASRAGTHDWPLGRGVLSDGSLASCRTAIYHLETQGAQFPLEPAGGLSDGRGRSTPRTRRLHVLAAKRAAARRAADPSQAFWDRAYGVTKLAGALEGLGVETVQLDQYSVDTVSDLDNDLTDLAEWVGRVHGAVVARLGEHRVRVKIAGLRAKTVERGASPHEADSARRRAEVLESRLRERLSA